MLPNSECRRLVTARRPSTAPAAPSSQQLPACTHATVAAPSSVSRSPWTARQPSSSIIWHRGTARRPTVPASLLRSILIGCWLMAISISAHQTNDLRRWPTLQQELADEQNDAQMLQAVQTSVGEWERHRQAAGSRALHNRVRRADKSVCYGDLGCFEDSGPFGYLDMLPSSPEEINTKFLFYSTKNRSDRPLVEIPYLNMTDAWKVFEPQTQPRKPGTRSWEALRTFEGLDVLSVRVIVHGFGSSCPHVWIYELRTALMAVEDCVVICVDWELGANLPNYVRAAANTRLIGKQLAMFLRGLQQYKGLDLSRVHIIGFSLGAHVSGFAGAELPGISRITGLDPAGPLFESQHPKARLDSTDANFVDVIHSNGENLILGGLGSWQPMGHVDFYPNGGRVQHGCSNLFVGAVTDFIWSQAAAVEGRSLCNHRRAYKFFIDSVAPRCLFPAFPCDSYDDFLKGHCFPCDQAQQDDPDVQAKCGNMGYYADRSTGRGQLYLVTREEEPFCAHQFNVDIFSSENDLPLRTLGRLDAILTGDGTLNETFTITEKDDTEFFAGETISRILVPHPALGFPHAIAMRYKSYSGWLSKGLAQWTIQKVVLTDSFGAKRSICRPEISLISDRYVHLELQSGECDLPEESSTTDSSDVFSTTMMAVESTERSDLNKLKDYQYSTSGPYDDDVDRLREKKEVIKLGSSYKISSSSSSAATDPDPALNGQLPWQPVLENSIDDTPQSSNDDTSSNLSKRTGHESGRSISDTSVVSTTKLASQEINEPILKSTTQRVAASTPVVEVKPRENSFFTIQLLPFRLGEFIERAERYARETLFPLFSEAPRLFGLGPSTTSSTSTSSSGALKSSRQPKYFPSLGELASTDTQAQESRRSQRRVDLPPAFSPTLTIEQPVFNYDRVAPDGNSTSTKPESRTIEDRADGVPAESEARSSKSVPNLLRPSAVNHSKSNDNDVPYYTSVLDALAGPNPVHIALPTYKPPVAHSTSKPNAFPYPFELVDPVPSATEPPAPRPAIAESTTTAPAG